MELIVCGIAFVICYFAIGLNWWISLLIALAFPVALSIVMYAIGVPLFGIAIGIGALINKIKQRGQGRYREPTWENVSESTEPQEGGMPLVIRAESFIVDTLDDGIQTRAELNTKGKILGYSEATIGKALDDLIETSEIEMIESGVYSKVAQLTDQDYTRESTGPLQTRATQPTPLTTARIAEEHKKKSNAFGTSSLVLGIISLIFWPEVTGTAAIVLGVLQFRRHATKRAIAGFTLGVVGIVLAVVFDLLGLYRLFP